MFILAIIKQKGDEQTTERQEWKLKDKPGVSHKTVVVVWDSMVTVKLVSNSQIWDIFRKQATRFPGVSGNGCKINSEIKIDYKVLRLSNWMNGIAIY